MGLFAGLLLIPALLFSACGGDTPAPSPGASDQAAPGVPSQAQQEAAYHKISAEDAKKRMDAGGVVIVDVRTPEEFAESHIPGAVNVPNETISTTQPEPLPDLGAEILVYCRTGVRSRQASVKLVRAGYTNINDFGGIADWPYETVKGADAG